MPSLSRRSFVELTCGLLTSLPVLAGGAILAPRPTYAEDDYTLDDQLAGKESEYVVIDVVAPWEVGFMVVDITKGEQRDGGLIHYPPVVGAHVSVTSRFNGQMAEGTTNENGVANIDVRQLAVHEDGQDVNELDDYYFNGSITVKSDGYRDFKTALVEVQGGEGLQVPAHPLDSDGPYPYLASFDDWDALYTKNDFPLTPKNDKTHTISTQMVGLPEAGTAAFELWVKGDKAPRARAQKVSVNDRSAAASFEGHFLQEGHADQIPEGAELQIVVRQQGHYPWIVTLNATTEKGAGDEPAEDNSGKQLTLINASSGSMGPNGLMSTGMKWPNIIPILGGGSLNFWTPTLPVNVSATPTGFVQITADFPIWGYRNDKGNGEPSNWGHYPRQSVQKQFDKKYDTMTKMAKKARSLASAPGKVKQLDLFKSVTFDLDFQLLALGKWDKKQNLYQGEAAGQLMAGFDFTITENFMAGPIPVLITFALNATLSFALQMATYVNVKKGELPIRAATDFSRWSFDFENTGLTLTFNITPSLSVGVGVRGVASISVKGSITLTLFICTPLGTQPKELPNPHFAAGWSANISLVIEVFLFTSSFALFDESFSYFYDNWDGKNVTAQATGEMRSTLAAKPLDELLSALVPITDEMLAQTSEASVAAQELAAPVDVSVLLGVDAAQDSGVVASLTELERTPLPMPTVAPEVTWLAARDTPSLPDLGVASLGMEGGIRPSSDTRLFGTDDRHVLGAARTKVVSFGTNETSGTDGGTWAFRLASVEVAGKMRTRIIANCISGPKNGAMRVVEFDTSASGIAHDDLYDYDFDVAGGYEKYTVEEGYTRSLFYLQLVVVSGRRADATTMTLAETSTDLVFSSALFVDELEFDLWYIDSWDRGAYDALDQAAKKAAEYYGTHSFFDASCMPLTISDLGSAVLGQDPDKRHSIMSVQIERCNTDWLDSILSPFYFVTTFLDRSADSAADTLRDDAQVHLGTFLTAWGLGDSWALPLGPHLILPNESSIAVDDGTTYEQALSLYDHKNLHGSGDYGGPATFKDVYFFLVMLRGARQVHYLSMYLNVETINYSDDSHKIYVYNHATSAGNFDPSIRLIPCSAQGYFLASYPTDEAQLSLTTEKRDFSTWTLHKVTCTNSGDYGDYEDIDSIPWARWNASLEFTPVGPTGFNVVNFAVNPAGTLLFWPHSRDADKDRIWNAEGKEDVQDREAVYQIMACRIRGDRFSDPFVLADLPSDTDALTVVSVNSKAVAEMLRTVYVDTGEKTKEGRPLYHAADIYYTAVPAVRCVTATACEAPHPFVSPGGKITFHVAVRNDGNTYLKGCTLQLCLHSEQTDTYDIVKGASESITFDKDTILESTYNPSDGKGGLQNLEDDYALAPGKTSVYAVTVTVPSDIPTGDQKVLFVATDGVLVDELYAQDDSERLEASATEFHVEPGDYKVVQVRTQPDQDPNQRHMDLISVREAHAGGMQYRTVFKENEEDGSPATPPRPPATPSGPSPTPSTPSGPSTQSARGGTALPNTGDGSGSLGLSLTGAGLAALGAAMAAYERRRAMNKES